MENHDYNRRGTTSRSDRSQSRHTAGSGSQAYGRNTGRYGSTSTSHHAGRSAQTSSRAPQSVQTSSRASQGAQRQQTGRSQSNYVPATTGYGQNAYGKQGGGAGANQYNRNNQAYQQKPKKKHKALKIVLIVVLVLILAAVGGAFFYMMRMQSTMQQGVTQDLRDKLVETNYSKEPFYMLLMGVDSSEERGSSDYDTTGARSDSMMLVRVDCPNKKVTMISLHRDTEIDMGQYGVQKLNAAHSLGGPALAVQTVSKLAGVPISHYAELNFDAFRDLVDAVGGIEVEVPMTIDDEKAGGYIEAGYQKLNGEQALILCRARHAYDDYGDGDVYRAANQRMVLGALAKKILASDVLTIANTVTALANYVTTDLSITDIVGIAQAMKGLDPSTDIYSAMEPTHGELVDGVWYEVLEEDSWKAMMKRVDAGLPPTETDYVDSTGTILSSAGTGNIQALAGHTDTGSSRTIGVDGTGYAGPGA